jgi:lipopolysaccharide export system protein LptA
MDYDLSLLELHLSNSKKDDSTGNLVVGGRFTVNKKTKQIEFESYEASPWRLAGIMER